MKIYDRTAGEIIKIKRCHSGLIFKESNTDQLSLSKMETIISNPGLHHLAEKVFWNLDGEDLKICAQMNQSCKQILQKFFLGYVKLY